MRVDQPIMEAVGIQQPEQTLGEILISAGVVNPVVIEYALQKQKIEGTSIGPLLVDLGFVSPRDIAKYLAVQRGIDFVDVSNLPEIQVDVASAFNRNLCLTHGFLPLQREDDTLLVVLGDAFPAEVASIVQRRLGLKVRCLQGEFQRVAQAIQEHYYFAENPAERLIEIGRAHV